jgi:hemin uptake protein HemP
MNVLRTLLLAGVLAAGLTSAPSLAERPRAQAPQAQQQSQAQRQSQGPHREQERAFEGRRDGRSMPLPQLERRVMPLMGGADYLGPEFNGKTYRMKFIQNGRVIWVDVDPQTGRIIRKSRDR